MAAASVRSADGTVIGYRLLGKGPGVILLHGGMQASHSLTKLAQALSRDFTVYVPDRRGRGMSAPHDAAGGIGPECEDVAALAAQTGAERIFGLSSGAIVALHAALTVPGLHKLALYEPPLSVNGSAPQGWVPRHAREVAAGDIPAAFVSAVKGLKTTRMALIPRPLLRAFGMLALKLERPVAGTVPIRALIPTIARDMRIVRETQDSLERFRALHAQVLLLAGSRSPAYLHTAVQGLAATLPHARQHLFRGMDHQGADNDGKPERVAEILRQFFL